MKTYKENSFGSINGQDVLAYTFENEIGYQLKVMNYGATILEYVTPDKKGNFTNIVLGFEKFESYPDNSPKYGASIGPVAGRIAGATFELNGLSYQLEQNNGRNCNHSGSTGWDSALFQVETVSNQGITFYTERSNGTGGFPANLKIWISYVLTEKGQVKISYVIETDQDTLVNPTNHSYFNLTGDWDTPIDQHIFQLNNEGVYLIAADGVPSKTVDKEASFAQKLRQGVLLRDLFESDDEQIRLVSGLDHPFELKKDCENAATLFEAKSGRLLTVQTDASCLVVYSANFLDEKVKLNGQTMKQHNGLALETQALPDAIHSNQKESVILKANQIFKSQTIYHAIVKE